MGLEISTPTGPHIRLQVLHQRYHRYVTCHEFVSEVNNEIFDPPSRSTDLTDTALFVHIGTTYSHRIPWRIYNPPSALDSIIVCTLWHTTSTRGSLTSKTPPPMGNRQNGTIYIGTWNSTPYVSRTGIGCLSSISSIGNTRKYKFIPSGNNYDP